MKEVPPEGPAIGCFSMTTEKVTEIAWEKETKPQVPKMNQLPLGILLTFAGFILGIIALLCMMSDIALWPLGDYGKTSTMYAFYLQSTMGIAVSVSFLGLAIILRNKLVRVVPKKTALVADNNPLGIWVVFIGTMFGIISAFLDIYLVWKTYSIESSSTDRLLFDVVEVLSYSSVPVQMFGLALICLITNPLKKEGADSALIIEAVGFFTFLIGIIAIALVRGGKAHDLDKYSFIFADLTVMGGIFLLSGIGLIITRGLPFEKLGTWKALGLTVCLFSMVPEMLTFAQLVMYRGVYSVYYYYYNLNLTMMNQNPMPLALLGLSIIFFAERKKDKFSDPWKARGFFFMVSGALLYFMGNYTFSTMYSSSIPDYYLYFGMVFDGLNSLVTLILIAGLGLIIWRSDRPGKIGIKKPKVIEKVIVVQEEPALVEPKTEDSPKEGKAEI